ncbi:MAG TPA: S41 family peptidase [Bacteroidales bacterium]|nr:S41 family peptidase [Bacteroidales bacterium]
MLKNIVIVLTTICLVLGALFLTIIIVRIRNIYFKKNARVPIWHKKVDILNKAGKLTMAISLFFSASGVIYYLFFVSTHLKFISVYVKIAFCIFFGAWALLEIFLCFSVSQKLLNGSIFKRIVFFFAVIICIIGAVYLFPPLSRSLLFPESSNNTQQVIFPETPCGYCASAYYKAFNSGEGDQMRTFIQKYRSESYLKSRTVTEQIESYKFMYMVSGILTPVRLIQISDYEIIIFSQTSKEGKLAKTRFKVDILEPHYLQIYTITPTTQEEALQITTIDQQIIGSTIDSLVVILRESYVDPEKGIMMADSLNHYKSNGRYDEINDGSVLSLRLTEDLWPLCHDKHLSVTYGKITEEESTSMPEIDSTYNYGFRISKVLENNIGYIRFDEFDGTDEAKRVAAKAFETVTDCDALIFDLRYNTGGSPKLVHFIYSYLFEEPTYVGSRYDRILNDTTDFWTQTDIPGKPFDDHVPLYILTGSNTFSAAEELAYFLKDMKRAIIVGETTSGGAHPIIHISVNDYFGVRIPFARMMSPVSLTDWEGTGVIPDIQVPMDEAMEAACKDAIKNLKN